MIRVFCGTSALDWRQVRVAAVQHQCDDIETLLWAEGAVSVTLTPRDAPDLLEPGPGETPVWETLTVTALFDAGTDVDPVAERLSRAGYLASSTALPDRVWEREWLRYFRPLAFGQRLWVCPTGFEVAEPGAIVLDLDPGLAFGTGTHPTTALCLEWLDGSLQPGCRVIDYGCGSGVLAIAAALLGAGQVTAIDNDPQALAATRSNACRNAVEVTCAAPGAELPGADLILANILAGPLMELRDMLCGAAAVGGMVVLSGIKPEQGEAMLAAYGQVLVDLQTTERDGWLRIVGRKPA